MAQSWTRRRFTREDKAQAVKRLPALNLILKLGERDLAHAREANGLSGGLREVDNPAVSVRTPIVDPHHHGAARALVGNPHPRAEGQALVRRRPSATLHPSAMDSAHAPRRRTSRRPCPA